MQTGGCRTMKKEAHLIRSQLYRLFATAMFLIVLPVMPMVAMAAETSGQKPCADEIEKFCKDVKPGGGRLLQCLREHGSQLSEACRNKVETTAKQVEEAQHACGNDLKKFCAEVAPGGGRLLNCLKQHVKEISPECREKLGAERARQGQ